jgi:hypothetical protein
MEIGGYTVVGNFFYERVIANNQKFKTTGQIGYGIEGIPIVINELISFDNNHFEFGLGFLIPGPFYKDGRSISKPYITGRLGYRYQRPNGGLIFRAGFMPTITRDKYGMYINGKLIFIWPGISIGFAF